MGMEFATKVTVLFIQFSNITRFFKDLSFDGRGIESTRHLIPDGIESTQHQIQPTNFDKIWVDSMLGGFDAGWNQYGGFDAPAF